MRRALRREIGFVCPVPGCQSPYLEWHHFDPPWHEFHHNDPAGMVALCSEHHKKADAGAFTNAQLRVFKRRGVPESLPSGKFDWRRPHLVTIVGGIVSIDCDIALRVYDHPAVWFSRDEDGQVLLSLDWLPDDRRFAMAENFWTVTPDLVDLECPPNGRILTAKFADGDYLKIEFRELPTLKAAVAVSETAHRWNLPFPLTAVLIDGTSRRRSFDVLRGRTLNEAASSVQDCLSRRTPVALQLGRPTRRLAAGFMLS